MKAYAPYIRCRQPKRIKNPQSPKMSEKRRYLLHLKRIGAKYLVLLILMGSEKPCKGVILNSVQDLLKQRAFVGEIPTRGEAD